MLPFCAAGMRSARPPTFCVYLPASSCRPHAASLTPRTSPAAGNRKLATATDETDGKKVTKIHYTVWVGGRGVGLKVNVKINKK